MVVVSGRKYVKECNPVGLAVNLNVKLVRR